MQNDLPVRPDLTPEPLTTAPAKHGFLRDLTTAVKVLLAIAVIGGLLVWGAIAVGTSQRDDTEASGIASAPADTGMTRQEAIDAAYPLALQVQDELEAASASADIVDVAGMVRHVRTAGDLMDEAAAYFLGVDDAVYTYMSSAADHFHASADAAEAGDFTTAAAEMMVASNDVDSATAAL